MDAPRSCLFRNPKNVFEGYNGRSTMVAISGLNYPVSHIYRLGDAVKAAYEKRQRNKKLVKELDDLDLTSYETHNPIVNKEHKPSKWDILKGKMNQ